MSSVFSLFNILALFYIFRSVQLAVRIGRQWTEFTGEPLTSEKKSLANQASFFIAVPIAVFFHEAAHALAIMATGGEVVEFQYRVFWGYVVPGGSFSQAEMWLIAIAGTLGSLLFGLILWLWLRKAQSSSIRYFALRAFRFQIYFSLIYYPLFTLLGFDGDWRTIYAFGNTPILSASTAVLHITILFLFWRFDRQGWFEAPAFHSVADQQQFAQIMAEAKANPQDLALQLQAIDSLRRGGAASKAKFQLQQLLNQNPDSGLAHLEMAALQSDRQDTISIEAAENAQAALDLGLSTTGQQLFAYRLLGHYYLERNNLHEALSNLSTALEFSTPSAQPVSQADVIDLLILRSQVFRRQHDYNAANQDLQQALALAENGGHDAAAQRIEVELDVLTKHAGQPSVTAPTRSTTEF